MQTELNQIMKKLKKDRECTRQTFCKEKKRGKMQKNKREYTEKKDKRKEGEKKEIQYRGIEGKGVLQERKKGE